MSSIWIRTYKSTPQLDCQMCGTPNCTTFARLLMVGEKELNECPILSLNDYAGLKSELESLLKRRNTRVKIAPELPEGGVLLTRPCKDSTEKLMAELRVFNGVEAGEELRFSVFDAKTMCDLMECLKDKFELVKCSRDLGYGRTDTGEMSITILHDGRVNMRRVQDKSHVLEMFNIIERILLPSAICNCCGSDLLSILNLDVPAKNPEGHPVIGAGSVITIDRSLVGESLTKEMLSNAFGDSAKKVTGNLDQLISSIYEHIEIVNTKSFDETYSIQTASLRCNLAGFVKSDTDDRSATIVMKVFGLLWMLESAVEGIVELHHQMKYLESGDIEKSEEIIRSAKDGRLGELEDIYREPGLLQVYANAKRIDRLVRFLKDWD